MGETDHSIAVPMYEVVTWQSQKKYTFFFPTSIRQKLRVAFVVEIPSKEIITMQCKLAITFSSFYKFEFTL